MNIKRTTFTCLLLVIGGIFFSGCYEWIAWSPDGRYVVFRSGENVLQLFDIQSKTSKVIYNGEEPAMVRYFPSGDMILLAVGEEDRDLITLNPESGEQKTILENVVIASWDLSRDGKQLYALTDEEGIRRYEIDQPKNSKKIAEIGEEEEVGFVCLRPDEKELLCCTEDAIFRINIETGGRVGEALKPGGESHGFIGVSWLDNSHFLYYLNDENGEDLMAALYVRDITANTSKKIVERCYFGFAPEVDSAKKFAYVTHIKEGSDTDDPSSFQIACITLEDGTFKILTDSKHGAFNPSLSPDEKQLAFLEGVEEEAAGLAILNLESGEILHSAVFQPNDKELNESEEE